MKLAVQPRRTTLMASTSTCQPELRLERSHGDAEHSEILEAVHLHRATGWACALVAHVGSLFGEADLPEDDLGVAQTPPASPAVPLIRPGDRVDVTEGLHAGRQGCVVFILPASGQYAKVEFVEGLRTIPTRYLRKLPAEPPARPGD